MNEEIKKLLNVSGLPNESLMALASGDNVELNAFYLENFAKLIIEQCANVCYASAAYSNECCKNTDDFHEKNIISAACVNALALAKKIKQRFDLE